MSRKANAALMMKLIPSPALSQLVGIKPISRGQAIKKVWHHIKNKNLQDPMNKRMIIIDEKLALLFPHKNSVSMFDLAKVVSHNLKKILGE